MIVEKKTFITSMLVLLTAITGVIFNSPIVCRGCVLLLFVICILRGMREKYYLNPYYMFALVPFTLLIYANISIYHLDLTVNTWLIAIINIAAFIGAFEFTPAYKNEKNCIGIQDTGSLLQNTYILLFLGYVGVVFQYIFGSTMPLASVFGLFSTAAVVCAFKSKKKSLIILVCLVTVVSWMTYVSKTSVLGFCLTTLICYEKYYLKTSKQRKRIIILEIIGIVIMIFSFSFANQDRGNSSASSVVAYYTMYGGLKWSGKDYLLMPYMYITTPWANLQHVIQTQASHTYGLWTLKPLLGYFQMDSLFTEWYSLRAYSSFNTFTYIAVLFKDFGFWGSCIGSTFLGFFVKKVYSRYTISKSPLDVACYVLVAQAVLEMFFSNHFFTQSYPFTIVIIMGIYKIIFCRGQIAEIEADENSKQIRGVV